MLKEHLPQHHIQLVEQCDTWQDSIILSAEPLLSDQCIEPSYVDSIFAQHRKIGPYFVIAPKIALPHSRPEDGVNKQGLSLLIVKNGIDFATDNDPIHLIAMFCATDNQTHLSMLASLAELLSDEEAVATLIRADTVEQVAKFIDDYPQS